ncbi:hypothetical protein [Treponema sp. R6D11]
MSKYSLTVPTWQKGCIEEMVILDETRNVFKYSFSNSLDNIKTAVFARTGINIDLEEAKWQQNHKLSISVKKLMNSYNVNYSMTTDIKDIDNKKFIIINMRVGDDWYVTGYEEEYGEFFSWEMLRILELFDLIKKSNTSSNDADNK